VLDDLDSTRRDCRRLRRAVKLVVGTTESWLHAPYVSRATVFVVDRNNVEAPRELEYPAAR
jgi:hypothetical protein